MDIACHVPPVQGIIFDKDGTLFDFSATWEAWAASFLLRISGDDVDRATVAGHAVGFDLAAQTFARDSVVIAGTPMQIAEALLPHFSAHDLPDLLRIMNAEAAAAPQAEAVALLPLLTTLKSRDLRLGVATNDAEMPARAHLDAAGVAECFDFIAGCDSGYGGKPAPGQLLAFCEQTGLTPDTVIMVGDSTHDLRAGLAAGMRTVAVLTGLAPADILAPFATAILPDIGALPAWLEDPSRP